MIIYIMTEITPQRVVWVVTQASSSSIARVGGTADETGCLTIQAHCSRRIRVRYFLGKDVLDKQVSITWKQASGPGGPAT